MEVSEFLEIELERILDRAIEEERTGKNSYYDDPLNLNNGAKQPVVSISVEELEIYEGQKTQMFHVQYFFDGREDVSSLDKIVKAKKWEPMSQSKNRRTYMHNDEPVNLRIFSDANQTYIELSYHINRNERFDNGEYSFVLIQLFNYLIDIFKEREGRQERDSSIDGLDLRKYDLLDIKDPKAVADKDTENEQKLNESETGSDLEGDVNVIIPANITRAKMPLIANGHKGVLWYYERARQIRASFPVGNKGKTNKVRLPDKYQINSGSYGTLIILNEIPPLTDAERKRLGNVVRNVIY